MNVTDTIADRDLEALRAAIAGRVFVGAGRSPAGGEISTPTLNSWSNSSPSPPASRPTRPLAATRTP